MDEKKQIEEMAEIVSRDCGHCQNCEYVGMKGDGVDCIDYFFAHSLYNAGYRKQSEGEWIKRTPYSEAECNQCRRCPKLIFGMLPKYCPNCGAKMKGGE